MVSGASSRTSESTTVNKKLQAKTGARVSKNGHGNEPRAGRNHPVGAYPRDELAMASSSSAEKKRSGEM